MELADFQTYLPLIGMTVGFLTAVLTGAKWVYHKYNTALDHRIVTKVCAEVDVINKKLAEHGSAIESLKTRFKDFQGYFKNE